MKHLIIFAHPNTDSLNATLKQMLVDHLQAQQHDVVVRDLYQLNYNPVLSLQDMQGQRARQVASEVKREQEFIARVYYVYLSDLVDGFAGNYERLYRQGV